MTPEQKIKHCIIQAATVQAAVNSGNFSEVFAVVNEDNVDELYESMMENDEDMINEMEHEFRQGQVETNVPPDYSRHYESKSVAVRMLDESWVGWTYWYGGGKHGEPESIDWMEDAYDLTLVEEEKLVVIQTFTKVDSKNG